ncbi:unnamed protein product [Cuscuta campestris]|uniref:SAP domain-containing protein n=1 Tax=Cuscuta campestris TaxID=132261 RepID=A0A484K6K9_9ASTE|nr:unnamed protein product [Cuscuta campestris]
MADERCQNPAQILISSSSSGSDQSETSGSEYEFDGDAVDTLSSTSRESDSENEESEWNETDDERDESSESEEVKEEENDHHLCRVMRLLRGKGDLQDLKLVECKAYLRKNGLRLSGTKDECIERIMEHRRYPIYVLSLLLIRIKDGKGETFYPRSSFNINCTGDVCKGDVVLFTQKVYKKYSPFFSHVV